MVRFYIKPWRVFKMASRFSGSCQGFTLIEIAFVMLASALLMSTGLTMYRGYMNDKYTNESYQKLRLVDSAISLFINARGRLPCPSDPRIPITDLNAGREIPIASCVFLRDPTTAPGTCQSGVCVVEGRDTDADSEALDGDPVLIGGLPFRDLKDAGSSSSASQQDSIDPWGFQFTFAVSGYLTDQSKYRASFGAIDVRTEPTVAVPAGVSVVDPVSSSQYVVIGHGKNHLGAYTAYGQIGFPCTPGVTRDSDNCDGNGSFTVGLRREANTVDYFDDTLFYNSYSLSMLWDFVGTTADIYNRNPGFVGIGTSTPTQQLDVAGDIKATTVTARNLCDKTDGSNCWSPDLLAAPAASGLSLYCPSTGVPGMADVVVGIGPDGSVPPKPRALCGTVPLVIPSLGSTCPAGQFVLSFNSAGVAQCGVP